MNSRVCHPPRRSPAASPARLARRLVTTLARMLALVTAAGCGGGGSTGPATPSSAAPVLTTVVVELPAITIQVGATVSAVATGLDQFGMPIASALPTWSTGTPSVATISATGVVTAHSSGQTQVVATVNGKEGRATLTVLDVPVAVVTIAPETMALVPGGSRQLAATILDANGRALAGRPMAWSSSDSATVTVTTSGVVTGVAPGTANVTASVGGKSAVATVALVATPVGFTGIQFRWKGQLDVSDMKWGPYVITVTATDDKGAIGVAALSYERDTRIGEVGGKTPPKNK